MNIFIETLSLYGKKRNEEIYHVSDVSMLPKGMMINDIGFVGCQTNEAPTKFIIWSLAQRNEVLDKIYIINSNETIGKELPFIDYHTTYTYYRESIIRYIDDLAQKNVFLAKYLKSYYGDYSINGYASMAEYYFYEIVDIDTVVSEKVVTSKWKRIVTEISSSKNVDMYFDFTGGSRLASITSMFILRWAESDSNRIKQVIYSDIITDPNSPRIVDCTETYRIMGKISSAESAPNEHKHQRRIELGAELGLNEEKDKQYAELLDKLETDAENDLNEKTQEEIEKLANELKQNAENSEYGKQKVNDDIKKLKETYKKTPFRKILDKLVNTKSTEHIDLLSIDFSILGRNKLEDFINGFYEELIVAFYNVKLIIIQVETDKPEDWLKGIIKANNDYYYKGYRGVIPTVKKWLSFSRNSSPKKVFERNTRVDNPFYASRVDSWSSLFGVSSVHNQQFINYLVNEQKIDYNTLSFETISKYQRVYFNYGFPFVMVYRGKGLIFPEITKKYYDLTKSFFEQMEDLKNSNRNAYRQKINDYVNDDDNFELEKVIPFVTEMPGAWSYNSDMFIEIDKDAFVKTLSDRLEIVRPYRNAIAHRVSYDNEYRQLDAQTKLVKQIVVWLLEYDAMFKTEGKNE